MRERVPVELPSGTVTFLFSDVEGSSRLWEERPDEMARFLERQEALIRASVRQHGGCVFKSMGDACFAAFAAPDRAARAALEAQLALHPTAGWEASSHPRVRMVLHAGQAEVHEGDYRGVALNRASRLLEVARGGQILLSGTARELLQAPLPDKVELRDLGSHRLRDLQQPERIYLLLRAGQDAGPALESLPDLLPNNLPRQVTSFVGREQELERLIRLLGGGSGASADVARLVTLTGPGGTGKTRLAVQAGAALLLEAGRGLRDGIWLVELAPLTDPALVAQAVARTLAVPEQPGEAVPDTLRNYLRERRALLILDNCEHLPAACPGLVRMLLGDCPGVRVLATSREPLGLDGESIVAVPGLTLPPHERAEGGTPPGEDLLAYESARLFVERSVAAAPSFALTSRNAPAVAEICRRLDGIPLALELAAARVKLLPVQAIARRLDDRFRLLTGGSRTALPRQQTLKALIDWSYDLLSDHERALLRRLSVFSSGWTEEAAEAVCGDVYPAAKVQDLLASLIDKSLVLVDRRQGEARYSLLETVRQYAVERLRDAGEEPAARGGHLAHFVGVAEEAEPHLLATEQGSWLDRLDREHDNFCAALEFSLSSAGPVGAALDAGEPGLRLAAALYLFWLKRRYLKEGREWLEGVLARSGGGAAGVVGMLRAKGLEAAGSLALHQGDYAAAEALGTESLLICREGGNEEQLSNTLRLLGSVAAQQGDYARALSLYEQSLARSREAGFGGSSAAALEALGLVALKQGDLATAESLFQTVLDMRRKLGDTGEVAGSLLNLGLAARLQGRMGEARALYQESLKLARLLRSRTTIGWALCDLALVLGREGDLAAAAAHLGESLETWGQLEGREGMVRCLEAAARLAWRRGQAGSAARLFGAAEAQREALNFPLPPVDQVDYDCVPEIRAGLGEESFRSAWAAGRSLTLDAAVALALEPGPAPEPTA